MGLSLMIALESGFSSASSSRGNLLFITLFLHCYENLLGSVSPQRVFLAVAEGVVHCGVNKVGRTDVVAQIQLVLRDSSMRFRVSVIQVVARNVICVETLRLC